MKLRKIFSLTLLALIAPGLLLSACTPTESPEESPAGRPWPPPDAASPSPSDAEDIFIPDISGLSSAELTGMMTAGWNLGNTLDAHWNARPWSSVTRPISQETLWGNPVTTKAMIDFVKASGFDTVRIPVTWYIFTGEGPDYIIDGAWMDRVQEVVDYVISNGMFAIINIHHDDHLSGSGWENGWLRLYGDGEPLTDGEKAGMHLRFGRLWAQISERFRDYSEYLIFEGINEPRTIGLERYSLEIWEEQSLFLNDLLQTFIDTVRQSGGKNADRHLLVSPYFASVGMDPDDREGRIAHFVDPESKTLRVSDPRGRLIVSLHYYEPWGFVTAPDDSQWFSSYFDLDVGSVSHNMNALFRIIKENFTDHGIPVIMGETGAVSRTMPDGGTNEAERVKWAEYYVSGMRSLGVPVIIWDDGGQFRLLDRTSLEWVWPDLAAALVSSAKR
jgi:endoglucanase